MLTQNILYFFILESDIYPVKAFKLYRNKLNPGADIFWQQPKVKLLDLNKEWYDASAVGGDPLNLTMKEISKNAELSMMYTNHCILATVVTNLNEARDIMARTGHRSESGIRSYAKKCPGKNKT